MSETTPRRAYLLAIVTHIGTTVITKQAVQIYSGSPWRDTSRSTARRDLRALARSGYLVPMTVGGMRCYGLGEGPGYRRRLREASRQQALLHVMHAEGGEWTVGRVKAAYRRIVGSHVYRATVRRDLARLHQLGHLDRHGDGTPRRFYTPSTKGGSA
jgi:DeoR/GlpR family transcriptional regulator of sugar metabolism